MFSELPNRSLKNRGEDMNKNLPARWSFWTWLLGGGQTNGGSNG
jgi:hypothetical protein